MKFVKEIEHFSEREDCALGELHLFTFVWCEQPRSEWEDSQNIAHDLGSNRRRLSVCAFHLVCVQKLAAIFRLHHKEIHYNEVWEGNCITWAQDTKLLMIAAGKHGLAAFSTGSVISSDQRSSFCCRCRCCFWCCPLVDFRLSGTSYLHSV